MLGRLALRLRHLVFLTTDCRQVDTFIVPDFPVDLCACCMQDVGAARADESGTEVLWVRAAWQNFSIGGGGQVRTVREQGSNRDAMAAPRAAWESVRSRTLATLEESRCRGGAKNLFDRPARDPIPSCLKFPPWGGHAVETRAEPRLWVRAVWQNFSIGVGGQVLTVREQGSNRGAMAAP